MEQMETGQSEQERAYNRNQWPIKRVAVCWECEMPQGSEHFKHFKHKFNKHFNWELHCSTEWTFNSADSSFTSCCRVHTFLWTWNCWGVELALLHATDHIPSLQNNNPLTYHFSHIFGFSDGSGNTWFLRQFQNFWFLRWFQNSVVLVNGSINAVSPFWPVSQITDLFFSSI